MTNQILETFYHQMLPLYRPQAEKFITTADAGAWNRVAFRYTFSVQAMTHIVVQKRFYRKVGNEILHPI